MFKNPEILTAGTSNRCVGVKADGMGKMRVSVRTPVCARARVRVCVCAFVFICD